VIDPRPLVMGDYQSAFDQILQHGGLFIVIAAPKEPVTYSFGAIGYNNTLEAKNHSIRTNYSFLKELDQVSLAQASGNELRVVGSGVLRSVADDIRPHAQEGA